MQTNFNSPNNPSRIRGFSPPPVDHIHFDLGVLRSRRAGRITHGGTVWRGPGPGCGKYDDSLSVKKTADGRLLRHSHRPGVSLSEIDDYIGLVRSGFTVAEDPGAKAARFAAMVKAREAAVMEEARKLGFVEDLYDECVPIDGTPAERYLSSRGIVGPRSRELLYHPFVSGTYREGGGPALVVPVNRLDQGRIAEHAE
jgi:hypothetical protein